MARYVPPNPDVTAQVDASQGPGPRSMRRMRVLVTGARGKVERATVPALQAAGHDVTATDLHEPEWDWQPAGTAWYVKAELTDAGQAYALINGAARGVGPRRVRCRRARSGDTRGGPARTAHALRRAALRRGGARLGSTLHLAAAELGAGRRVVRATSGPSSASSAGQASPDGPMWTPTTWPRRSGSRSSPTCPAGTCTRRGGRRTRTPRPSCAPCRVGTPPAYPPARPRSCWAGEPPARGATTSPRRGNPSRVATAETQRPVQRRGFLGDGHRLVEDAHAPALLGGLGDEPVGHLGGVVVNAVVLAGCSRQVPAVDDQVCGEHGRGEPGRHLRRSNPDGLR